MMSVINYIRPIPNIDGTVRDIRAKAEDGRFDYGLGYVSELDFNDIDVRYLVNVIQEVTMVSVPDPSWFCQ